MFVFSPSVNEVTMEFSATCVTQNPITKEDVRILVTEAKQFMEKEAAVLKSGGDPVSELADTAFFKPLPENKAKKENGLKLEHLDQAENTIKGITVIENRQTDRMGKIIKGSSFTKLKRLSIRISHDHKSSVSCVLV